MPDESGTTVAPPAAPAAGTTPAPTIIVDGGQPPAPPAEPPVPVTSFLDEAGVLQEGWLEALVPEDFRGRRVFSTFTDVAGMMKQLGHLDLLVSRQGKGIMPLSEDATPTERELYYEALGRPKKADDYEIPTPEGLEDYYDEGLLKEAREALHGAGLTQAQVDAVMALDAKRITDGIAQSEQADDAARKEAEETLRKKWGDAYDERKALANRMIGENVAAEDEEKVLEVIGNNPYVADFLANIGKKFMEGKLVTPDAVPEGAMTPAEAKLKMNELIAERAKEPNMRWENPAKYERMNKDIERLSAASLAGQG